MLFTLQRITVRHYCASDSYFVSLSVATAEKSTLHVLSSSWDGRPFGHNRHGPKVGGLCPFGGGVDGSPSNTMWPWPRPTSLPSGILIYPAILPQQAWAENCGGCAPLGEGELGPHLTVWLGPRPTSVPSCTLIHPAVWSQQAWPKIWGRLCPFGRGSSVPI